MHTRLYNKSSGCCCILSHTAMMASVVMRRMKISDGYQMVIFSRRVLDFLADELSYS